VERIVGRLRLARFRKGRLVGTRSALWAGRQPAITARIFDTIAIPPLVVDPMEVLR